MAQESSLGNLLSLFQAFTGKNTTTTSGGGTTTQTTKSSLSEEDVQKLLQSALESNSGLASVAGGQLGSGVYNSTVNTQLTNDLLTRLSTQLAANNADKTVTTVTPATTQTTSTPGLGLGGAATIGALALGKNLLDPVLSGKKSVWDIFGGDSSSSSDSSADIVPNIDLSNSMPVSSSDLFGSLSSGVDSVTNSVGDWASNLFSVGGSESSSSILDLAGLGDSENSWLGDLFDNWF